MRHISKSGTVRNASALFLPFSILHSSLKMNLALDSLGIIAGNRTLPLEFTQQARAAGVKKLVAVAFENETDPALANFGNENAWLESGQLSTILAPLTARKMSQCVVVGHSATKNLHELRPDLRMVGMLFRLKEKNA